MEKTITIKRKARPALVVIGSLFLLAVSGLALWVLWSYVFSQLEGFWKLKITAITCIVVVPLWAIYMIIRQSFKKKPALVIDEQGVTDDSNMISVGFIPWSDITSINEAANEFKHKLIVVNVKNPDVYIKKSSRMQESRRVQYKQFGSPVIISARSLDCNPEELVATLRDRIVKS